MRLGVVSGGLYKEWKKWNNMADTRDLETMADNERI
jgi:hypothetical protein